MTHTYNYEYSVRTYHTCSYSSVFLTLLRHTIDFHSLSNASTLATTTATTALPSHHHPFYLFSSTTSICSHDDDACQQPMWPNLSPGPVSRTQRVRIYHGKYVETNIIVGFEVCGWRKSPFRDRAGGRSSVAEEESCQIYPLNWCLHSQPRITI